MAVQGQASLWLAGGLSLFVGLYYACSWRDKASKMPYVCLAACLAHYVSSCSLHLYLGQLFACHLPIGAVSQRKLLHEQKTITEALMLMQAPKQFPYNNLEEELGKVPQSDRLTDLPGDNA